MKAEWGKKRSCLNCKARFYDLNQPAPVCPKCNTVFEIITYAPKSRRGRPSLDATRDLLIDDLDLDLGTDVASGSDSDMIVDEDGLDEDLNDIPDVGNDDRDDS